MAGHSKWANIKHRKGAQDAARAKIFAKLSKEIMVAAVVGGTDPNSNASLRLAITKARAKSMPKKNIEAAISKGDKNPKDSNFKEHIYAGNVGGVSFLVYCLTDNPNRLSSNIQSYFNRVNGTLSSPSSVNYIFDRKGIIEFPKTDSLSEEQILEIALESGALDLESTNESHFVYTNPENFDVVKEALERNHINNFKNASIDFMPNQEQKLNEEKFNSMLNFIDRLENDDDIQEVYHNLSPDIV